MERFSPNAYVSVIKTKQATTSGKQNLRKKLYLSIYLSMNCDFMSDSTDLMVF